jgi:dTMP kinase
VFVTFEGLDGSGKTTQVELLRDALEQDGQSVVATREPGGTPLGERVRELLLESDHVAPWAEAALFAAARAELVERVIAPALSRGDTVLCDRFLDSSLAYQGIARGLGIERVLELNLNAIRGLLPDRTFLLLVDPEQAAERTGAPRDRIEREGGQFLVEVDRAYRELARIFPQRIEALDAARPATELAEEIHGRLRDGS